MKPLSDETRGLLVRVKNHPAPWKLLGRDHSGQVELLEQVAARKELASVWPLLDFLFDQPAPVAAASDAIAHILAHTAPADLVTLDELARGHTHWERADGWRGLQAWQVTRLPRTAASRAGVLGLASFHRLGQVRERAIRLLADLDDGAALPFLLIRCHARQCRGRGVDARLRDDRLHLRGGDPRFLRSHAALVPRGSGRTGEEPDAGLLERASEVVIPASNAALEANCSSRGERTRLR